jgi:hypothetical protein
MKISKWIIFKEALFVLFYPFLAFDIFLFYDDGANDFQIVGALWILIFAVAIIFYVYQRKKTKEKILISHIAELFFFSFEVLFFVANVFLVGLFLYVVYTGNQFLI